MAPRAPPPAASGAAREAALVKAENGVVDDMVRALESLPEVGETVTRQVDRVRGVLRRAPLALRTVHSARESALRQDMHQRAAWLRTEFTTLLRDLEGRVERTRAADALERGRLASALQRALAERDHADAALRSLGAWLSAGGIWVVPDFSLRTGGAAQASPASRATVLTFPAPREGGGGRRGSGGSSVGGGSVLGAAGVAIAQGGAGKMRAAALAVSAAVRPRKGVRGGIVADVGGGGGATERKWLSEGTQTDGATLELARERDESAREWSLVEDLVLGRDGAVAAQFVRRLVAAVVAIIAHEC